MLRFAIRSLGDNRRRNDLEHNALFEVFCLHARNLIEFFKAKNKKKLAYLPCDFTVPGYTTAIDGRAIGRISAQVSHLSKGRTKNEAEKINGREMVKIHRDIEAEIARFGRHLKPEWTTAWKASDASTPPKIILDFSGMHAFTTTTAASAASIFFND